MSTPPRDPPPGGKSPGPQEPAAEEPRCPRCGAPHDPLQEYCLECGLRLVPLPRERFVRTTVWSRESPIWFWLALGALLLVALAAGGIVALAATDEDDAGAGASSQPAGGAVPLPPTTITIETITGPTTSTLAPPTTSTMATTTTGSTTTTGLTTTTGSTTTNPDEIISWPSGTDGYTVVLQSTPASQGRGPAEAAAEDAIDEGLSEVGILNSSNYSSLNPGYYVTFTGVYDTQSQAENALPTARSKGFPTAYVRRVAD